MRPLVLHDPTVRAIVYPCWIAWVVAEAALAQRTRRRGGRDRSYRVAVVSMLVAIGGAFQAARVAHLPDGGWWPVVAGLVLFWMGIAVRAWAVFTLGRFFSVVVTVQAEHRVVDRGPYRVVRHPSYTGLLLILLGVGVALDSWAAVAAIVLIPLAGLLYRISVEERALAAELGDAYLAYARGRRRLVPGVW